MQVPLNSRAINAVYDLPAAVECEYIKFTKNMMEKKLGGGFKTLTIQGSEWMNREGQVVSKIDLKPITKV